MARRFSSFGFLGRFGRSSDLRQLDAALRAVDLHPALVPEGVKLAAVNVLKDHAADGDPPATAYAQAAPLIAYGMVGREGFSQANGVHAEEHVAARIERALEADDSVDAQLLLLLFHAGLLQPSVVADHGIDVDQE